MPESQKPLTDGEAGGCLLPEMSKNRTKKSLMLSNERRRERWEMKIKKEKPAYGRFWKPYVKIKIEAVGINFSLEIPRSERKEKNIYWVNGPSGSSKRFFSPERNRPCEGSESGTTF